MDGSDYYGSSPDLTIEAFYDVVRAAPRPVLRWEVAVDKSFYNAVFYLLCCFLKLHLAQFGDDRFEFSTGNLLAFLSIDRLEHLCYLLQL